MNNKVLTLLGFASKAGALAFGAARTAEAVRRHRAKSVFYANDISEKSRKEILFQCEKNGVRAFALNGISMEMLSKGVGRSCAVVAVTDDSFTAPIISNL